MFEDDETPKVTCQLCKTVFEGLSPDQAYHCAADYSARHGIIVGHYGSTVIDLQVWKVLDNTGLDTDGGQVCDTCLKAMIDRGAIVFQENYAP